MLSWVRVEREPYTTTCLSCTLQYSKKKLYVAVTNAKKEHIDLRKYWQDDGIIKSADGCRLCTWLILQSCLVDCIIDSRLEV